MLVVDMLNYFIVLHEQEHMKVGGPFPGGECAFGRLHDGLCIYDIKMIKITENTK